MELDSNNIDNKESDEPSAPNLTPVPPNVDSTSFQIFQQPSHSDPETSSIPNHKSGLNWKLISIVAIIVIAVASLAVGSTYYAMSQQANDDKLSI
jgi:hypothetical protein